MQLQFIPEDGRYRLPARIIGQAPDSDNRFYRYGIQVVLQMEE